MLSNVFVIQCFCWLLEFVCFVYIFDLNWQIHGYVYYQWYKLDGQWIFGIFSIFKGSVMVDDIIVAQGCFKTVTIHFRFCDFFVFDVFELLFCFFRSCVHQWRWFMMYMVQIISNLSWVVMVHLIIILLQMMVQWASTCYMVRTISDVVAESA